MYRSESTPVGMVPGGSGLSVTMTPMRSWPVCREARQCLAGDLLTIQTNNRQVEAEDRVIDQDDPGASFEQAGIAGWLGALSLRHEAGNSVTNQIVQVRAFPVNVLVGVTDGDGVGAWSTHGLDGLDDIGVHQVGDIRHHQCNRRVPAGGERAGDAVGLIAERPGCFEDALTCSVAHPDFAGQHVGDGATRDTGEPRDILNRADGIPPSHSRKL